MSKASSFGIVILDLLGHSRLVIGHFALSYICCAWFWAVRTQRSSQSSLLIEHLVEVHHQTGNHAQRRKLDNRQSLVCLRLPGCQELLRILGVRSVVGEILLISAIRTAALVLIETAGEQVPGDEVYTSEPLESTCALRLAPRRSNASAISRLPSAARCHSGNACE